MKCLHKAKLTKKMFDLLKNKVYVGISAGSMITAKDL
jgi:peptidase E